MITRSCLKSYTKREFEKKRTIGSTNLRTDPQLIIVEKFSLQLRFIML